MRITFGRLAVGMVLVGTSCTRGGELTRSDVTVRGEPGAPLPGLSADELARFEAGRAAFSRLYTPEEGLGPLYTENSCNACHHEPETGGGGGVPDTHASRFVEPDSCDTMREEEGFIRREATPLMRSFATDRKEPPAGATEIGRFFSPQLYGRGLIEAIPDQSIMALADPDDRDQDGISGRVSRLADGRLGRFRRKADRAAIRDLAEAGARFALGLTTPDYPTELPYRGRPLPPGVDPAPDPEIDSAVTGAIVDFIRFLAPPARSAPVDEADRRVIARGDRAFRAIGCADCHVPGLLTGPNQVAALDRKVVPLYSDLLLHDMGPTLADVCGPSATPAELRTEPLWGLQYRRRFMHDGRAQSMPEAISLHGGESASSRNAYFRLDIETQEAVTRFLWTL